MLFFDPSILTAAAQAVYNAAAQAKTNKAQCGLLVNRVEFVMAQIAASSRIFSQLKYTAPLTQLKSLLDECKEYIEKFQQKNWLQRMLFGSSHQEKFEELNNRLKDSLQDLQLGCDVAILDNLQEFHHCAEQDRLFMMANQQEIFKEIQQQFKGQAALIASIGNRVNVVLQPQEAEHAKDTAIKRVMARHAVVAKDLFFEQQMQIRTDGEFWRGKDLARPVCLQKVAIIPEVKEKFIQQVAIHGRLFHRNILQFYSACFDAGTECLVLEPIKYFLSERFHGLSIQQQTSIANDVLQGLDYLHRRQVKHGNLSVMNIALTEDNVAKLTGFDYAHASTATVAALGLPALISQWRAWAAPERRQDITQVPTPEADVYSFGLLLYALATGNMPREDQVMNAETLKVVDSSFVPWIIVCCDPDPKKRPTTQDLIARVTRFQGFTRIAPAIVALPNSKLTYQKANDAYNIKDYRNAVTLYQQAIREGSARAKSNLALLYWRGVGVLKNTQEAFRLWQEAASAGDPKGMYNVAACYETGAHTGARGADLQQAIYWYTCAADFEFMDSRKKLVALLHKVTNGEPSAPPM